jgi:hypothetical protein|tara:strand:- start:5303 stop:5512 length:210 start_codon:yes stop_codon:yes gene_type:complete
MKTFIFLVSIVLFGISIYYYCSIKGKFKVFSDGAKDSRIVKIQRAQKNLHPHYNKNVDRGPRGRFKKKE